MTFNIIRSFNLDSFSEKKLEQSKNWSYLNEEPFVFCLLLSLWAKVRVTLWWLGEAE